MAISNDIQNTDEIWVSVAPDPIPKGQKGANAPQRGGWRLPLSRSAPSQEELNRLVDTFRCTGQI
jgi:hypothetical protein